MKTDFFICIGPPGKYDSGPMFHTISGSIDGLKEKLVPWYSHELAGYKIGKFTLEIEEI